MNQDHTVFVGQKLRIGFIIRDEDKKIVDLSTAGYSTSLVLKRTGGSKLTKAVVFTTDGTDGGCYYDTIATDFDAPGVFKCQCIVTDDTGGEFPSTTVTITVTARI